MLTQFKKLTDLPLKQKIMLVFALVIFFLVFYQIFGMFSDSNTQSSKLENSDTKNNSPAALKSENLAHARAPAPAAAAPATPATPAPAPAAVGKVNPDVASQNNSLAPPIAQPGSAPVPVQPAVIPANVVPVTPQAATINDAAFTGYSGKSDYFKMLNELQDLKFKLQLYNAQQALYSAEMAALKMKQDLDLLKNQQSGGAADVALKSKNNPVNPPVGVAKDNNYIPNTVAYGVKSITFEHNKWHAVLTYQNQYYDIVIGDILAVDNSEVVSISAKGVTLQNDSMAIRLPFNSSDTLTSNTNGAGVQNDKHQP